MLKLKKDEPNNAEGLYVYERRKMSEGNGKKGNIMGEGSKWVGNWIEESGEYNRMDRRHMMIGAGDLGIMKEGREKYT